MTETKRAIKLWWGWEPEVIENWLEQKEAEGWHLFNINTQIIFNFVKAKPKKVRYCADYQSTLDPEYKALFQDAGWELVYKSAGWYIWRMEYTGERPDIYTDIESLMGRNKRLMTILGFIALAELPIAISTLTNTSVSYYSNSALLTLIVFFYGFIGYGVYRLSAVNNRLKERKKL
jgi:hypothetical protein